MPITALQNQEKEGFIEFLRIYQCLPGIKKLREKKEKGNFNVERITIKKCQLPLKIRAYSVSLLKALLVFCSWPQLFKGWIALSTG